jgi:hypothetical protein
MPAQASSWCSFTDENFLRRKRAWWPSPSGVRHGLTQLPCNQRSRVSFWNEPHLPLLPKQMSSVSNHQKSIGGSHAGSPVPIAWMIPGACRHTAIADVKSAQPRHWAGWRVWPLCGWRRPPSQRPQPGSRRQLLHIGHLGHPPTVAQPSPRRRPDLRGTNQTVSISPLHHESDWNYFLVNCRG